MTVKTLHISNTQVLKLSSEINSKHSKEFHYFKRLWGGTFKEKFRKEVRHKDNRGKR